MNNSGCPDPFCPVAWIPAWSLLQTRVTWGTVKDSLVVSLGQVPLSSAKYQDRPNSKGPWGSGWDYYSPLGESQAGRFQLPTPQAAQLSLAVFFAEDGPTEERDSFHS